MTVNHYFDHASLSPLRPEALQAVQRVSNNLAHTEMGDPSRIYRQGMTTRVELENARQKVAEMLQAKSREIVFTSGASESISTATWGALHRAKENGQIPRVIHSSVEHSSVRQSSQLFAHALNGEVFVVPVDAAGRIDLDAFKATFDESISLVHLQYGNHEVGTLQPIAEVAEICQKTKALLHIDATHAVGQVPLAVNDLGADLLSFGGCEFGAPTSVGVLWIRQGLRLQPLLTGGDQERARRAGIEPISSAIALGDVCAQLNRETLQRQQHRYRQLTERVASELQTIEGVSELGDPRNRLDHLLSLAIADIEPQAIVLGLDQRGISVHSGSSCASEGIEPSPVLEAMGADAHRSMRISVGWTTTDQDVDALCQAVPEIIHELRQLR